MKQPPPANTSFNWPYFCPGAGAKKQPKYTAICMLGFCILAGLKIPNFEVYIFVYILLKQSWWDIWDIPRKIQE